MGRILLAATPKSTWKDWLFRNREGRDLLIADPSSTQYGPPGRLILVRGESVIAWRFFGGLNALRSPFRIYSAVAELLEQASEDALVELFPQRPLPALQELTFHLTRLIKPLETICDRKLEGSTEMFPAPTLVDLEAGHQATLQTALRKAQWLKLRQECHLHRMMLHETGFVGGRIGSGEPLDLETRTRIGWTAGQHAEVSGRTLFVVSNEPLERASIASALEVTGATKVEVAMTSDYSNLLCALLDHDGSEIGMGFIESLDLDAGEAFVASNAIPPVPVRWIQLGMLYVDQQGRERGEPKLFGI